MILAIIELNNIKQKLRFFKVYGHDKTTIVGEATEAIKKECEGPGELLGYRTMLHKIKQVHDLNVTRDQVYATMTDVDPHELENRKPIIKKKETKGLIIWRFSTRVENQYTVLKSHLS